MFWSETANCVVTLMNIVYTSSNTRITPYEAFYGEKTHLARIHPYGSKCFLLNPDPKIKEWDAKGIEAILLGFDEKVETYRLWIPSLRRCEIPKRELFQQRRKLNKN